MFSVRVCVDCDSRLKIWVGGCGWVCQLLPQELVKLEVQTARCSRGTSTLGDGSETEPPVLVILL